MQRNNLERIIELRHFLHRRAELSLHEAETGRILQDFLRRNTSLEIVQRDGWFYAVKQGARSAEAVAFRADMDALPIEEGIGLPYASEHPGVSHKCGHDGHCAALCGLALELEHTETDRPVYLIFQKAEEIGAGGAEAAELIGEMGIREVYAFHNLSGYPEGSVIYRRGLTQPASEGMKILFYGKQSHAAAPEDGINPAEVIAETVLHIRDLLSKEHRGMVLCTIAGMEAGSGDFGISAGDGSISVTLRASEEAELLEMEDDIRTFALEHASVKGIRTEVQISDRFPETRNSDFGIDRVLASASRLGVPCLSMEQMWRASEDFGHYLKKCGGAMFYIGNGEKWPALHTAEYDFNDRILERVVDLFVIMAGRSLI